MRRPSARSVGIAALYVVITAGLLVGGAHRAAAADDAPDNLPRVPAGCGGAAYTPRQWQGRLIAKSDSECDSPWYMKLTVRLQRRVDGVWRTRAIMTAVSSEPTVFLRVRASAVC